MIWLNQLIFLVSETQYSNIPEIFHYDNFDRCMMLDDDALYYSVTYELQSLNNETLSETWLTIQVSYSQKCFKVLYLIGFI